MKKEKISLDDIQIIGDNLLVNDGQVQAYYILPLHNYSVAAAPGIERNVGELVTLIGSAASHHPDIKFTIERCSKVIKAEDIYQNLIETTKIYLEDYTLPDEFAKSIKNLNQDYCFLIVTLDTRSSGDIEDYTLKDTAKEIIKSGVNKIVAATDSVIEVERLLAIENNLFNTLKVKCARATPDLIFYDYVSKLYPLYEISYDKLSYFNENTFTSVLGAVNQTVEDKFGYFILHNEGVDLFGLIPQDTYGCMLHVHAFPTVIDTAEFSMALPNTQVTVQCLKKEAAELKVKRKRSAVEFEFEEAQWAGAPVEQLDDLREGYSLAGEAIHSIREGNVPCVFATNILVQSDTLESLKSKVALTTHMLKDRDILVSKSLTQAKDFISSYVNLSPKKLPHFTTLEFPLSFQQNYGCIVGDFDNSRGIMVPTIGKDI